MITYDNGNQFRIIFSLTGSVLPSCLPVGLTTFLIGLGLALVRQFDTEEKFFTTNKEKYIADPFAIQIIAVVVGYLLVVRTNMALSRWMEGISDIQLMLSKWGDAFDALNAFFTGKTGTVEQQKEILMFRIRVAHWFSLMSCLAFATLRNHGELGPLEEVPIKELFDESQAARAKSFASSRIYANRRMSSGKRISHAGTTGTDATGASSRRLSLNGSLYDADADLMKNLNSVSSSKKKDPDLISDLDLLVLSVPSAEEVALLEQANDKPNAICLWIIQGVILMIRQKLLDIPPPIVSRVFQELSNGMLGFNQAHKVAMVPFPFPFAQMVSLLLLILYTCMPLYIDLFTQNPVITPLVSFLLPMVYCALNTIAVELEEPFGTDHNDVDIEIRHEDFLWLLVDVLRSPKMCPVGETSVLEETVLRGVLRDCPIIAPELAKYAEPEEPPKMGATFSLASGTQSTAVTAAASK